MIHMTFPSLFCYTFWFPQNCHNPFSIISKTKCSPHNTEFINLYLRQFYCYAFQFVILFLNFFHHFGFFLLSICLRHTLHYYCPSFAGLSTSSDSVVCEWNTDADECPSSSKMPCDGKWWMLVDVVAIAGGGRFVLAAVAEWWCVSGNIGDWFSVTKDVSISNVSESFVFGWLTGALVRSNLFGLGSWLRVGSTIVCLWLPLSSSSLMLHTSMDMSSIFLSSSGASGNW